jgi:hypothetical protein
MARLHIAIEKGLKKLHCLLVVLTCILILNGIFVTLLVTGLDELSFLNATAS